MGLTREQCRLLGIEHLYPKASEARPLPPIPRPPSKAVDDGMNKLERHFHRRALDAVAAGVLLGVWREPITLRLAGRTRYTPDFLTRDRDGDLCFWETKGFMRDDANVKLKVAAEQYPFFGFVLVTRTKQRWDCRTVRRTGIDLRVWRPIWLE